MNAADTRPLPLVQATCVLVGAGAVLIRGRPGSGKSSLAAALIGLDSPSLLVRLVADDAVLLRIKGGRLIAIAPETTAGLIEMRGVGILSRPYERRAVVNLVVDLVDAAAIERLPEAGDAVTRIDGVEVVRIVLPENDSASPERVLAAIADLTARGKVVAEDGMGVPPTARIRA